MNKIKLIISWILRVLTSIIFILASAGKLINDPQVLQMFKNWGFSEGFHYLIGILEFIFAILLLIPKTLKVAIFGICIIMIGAVVTHALHDPVLNILRPITFLLFLCVVYFINFIRKN